MIRNRFRAINSEEQGFALVVAMLLLAVMMISLVVALQAGTSSFQEAEYGVRWTRTLSIAEAGVDDAIVRLGENRLSASPCPSTGSVVCSTSDGEYQVDWTSGSDGSMTVTSTGYYPSKASVQFDRQVQVLLEPSPTFNYAIFSQNDLVVKNNMVINGSIYSTGSILIEGNAVVCGSVVSANSSIVTENNTDIVKANSTSGCSGQDGLVWAGGSISNGGTIEGDARASAPSGTTCSATSSSYSITGGSVLGQATACGMITSTSTNPMPGTNTTPPAVRTFPTFTFSTANYASLACYPGTGTCDPANTSTTAVSEFNVFKAANKLNMKGTYAVWQTSPTKTTTVDLEDIYLTGDLTIITNAPIDFGNTSFISSSVPARLIIISTYVPPSGTSCSTNGGDCSIYSKNKIEFDRGVITDPNDGIAGLLYTTGKMAIKNQGSAADGALYAGSMDIKNGFDITWNPRIAQVLGFGTGLEQTRWQELAT